MADNCYTDRDADGLVTAPVLIGQIGCEERDEIDPEGVESVDGLRSLWPPTQRTGDTLRTRATGTGVVIRAGRTTI